MLRVHWLVYVLSTAAPSSAPLTTAAASLPVSPSPLSASVLASLLPSDESAASNRFVHEVDRLRAVVSRCAVRVFLSLATGQTRRTRCVLPPLRCSAVCPSPRCAADEAV